MNDIAVLEKIDPVVVYSGGLDSVLENLAKEARSVELDISTDKGRKEIASNAYKVARSKTLLDDMGKKLGEEAKAKLDAINADRKKARDFLDSLKDEVRKPLTDWENAEKLRVSVREERIAQIVNMATPYIPDPDIETIKAHIAQVEETSVFDWQEFSARAEVATSTSMAKLQAMLSEREKRDAERAELERLRKEQADRERQEREAEIARQAAEKARIMAEQKAENERKASEAVAMAQKRAEEERLEAERKAAADRERKAREAKELAERQAAEAKARAEKAERDAKEAAERAAREERERIEAERKKIEADAAAREADKKHRARINNEAKTALNECTNDDELSKLIITAIANGKIAHVKIVY